MRTVVLGAMLALLAGCATSSEITKDDPLDLFSGGRMQGPSLQKAIAEAAKHPLGSQRNPIRVNMPPGQREYLSRLRCSDGKPPLFERVGNFGAGVFGSIIDGYRVVCPTGQPRESLIFMDMYHPTHTETQAPPGFTIVSPDAPRGQAV